MKLKFITFFLAFSVLAFFAEPFSSSATRIRIFDSFPETEEFLPSTAPWIFFSDQSRQEHSKKKNKEVEALMYKQKEVTFTNKDITIAGTLTIPEKPGRYPAVVLLAGSGPLNRDEEVFGMKPFRIIADHFTQKGFAVLRYDARGVGGSTGNFYQSTFYDFAEDALAAIHYLKSQKDINPAQIGLCGHSQGGVVAPIVASRSDDVAYIICIAGAGQTGEEGFITQNELISKLEGATEKDIEELTQIQKQLFELIRKDENPDKFKPLLMRMANKHMKIQGKRGEREEGDIKRALEEKTGCLLTLYGSPWGRFFLDYDPKPVLEKVKCPVLLLFGGLDQQVALEPNKRAMIESLKRGGNNDITIKIFPKANHVFQSAITGHPSEYAKLPKEFIPGFLEFMSDWLLQRGNRGE
jgi:pimeloyl-ACP methyl ester carboxylesterase